MQNLFDIQQRQNRIRLRKIHILEATSITVTYIYINKISKKFYFWPILIRPTHLDSRISLVSQLKFR